MWNIESVVRAPEGEELAPWNELLQDSVNNGASIGFLRPLSATTAEKFWAEVFGEVHLGKRIVLAARENERLLGSVQLGLCTRENGLHRAELQKLLVYTQARRRGIAKALMSAAEAEAQRRKRTLLYLDTEPDQPAETLYLQLGWTRAGSIPNYASTPDGILHSTTIYYRML